MGRQLGIFGGARGAGLVLGNFTIAGLRISICD